jgi:hypothetical protein
MCRTSSEQSLLKRPGLLACPEKNPGAPRGDYFETLADAAQMSLKERAEFMIRPDTYWV